jgi:repressor LexA
MKAELTPRQLEIYEFICRFSKEHGHSPTQNEIAIAFKFSTPIGAQSHLSAIEKKGYITRAAGKPRTIRIL